jgi:hypothetical protein
MKKVTPDELGRFLRESKDKPNIINIEELGEEFNAEFVKSNFAGYVLMNIATSEEFRREPEVSATVKYLRGVRLGIRIAEWIMEMRELERLEKIEV